MHTSRFQIITPNDLDDYRDRANEIAEASWPEFMLHDPIADEYWHELFDRFIDYQFAMLDAETNRMEAMGNSLPLHWDKDLSELPEGGWDWVFVKATEDHKNGVVPNIQSAIQVAVHPDYRGQGLSTKMVQAMRAIGQSKGLKYLLAPVRPNEKSKYPLTSIDDYITWRTDDGLPFDAWLRVHARLGGRIFKTCHESKTIRGTRVDWEAWTEIKFPQSGEYIFPGAFVPIQMNIEKNEGVYMEQNVWVLHKIG